MKRFVIAVALALAPFWATHVIWAAGFFKVGEKAPGFALTSVTGDAVALET